MNSSVELQPHEEEHLVGLLRAGRAVRWSGKTFDADPSLVNPDGFDHQAMDGLVDHGLVKVRKHLVMPGAEESPVLLSYKLSPKGDKHAERLHYKFRFGRRSAEGNTGEV